MPRQLVTDNLAVVLVVFDEKDADGIRFALLVGLVHWLEIGEAMAHGAGGRRGRLMSPPWASLLEGASARGTLFFPPLVSHLFQSSHIWYSTGAQCLRRSLSTSNPSLRLSPSAASTMSGRATAAWRSRAFPSSPPPRQRARSSITTACRTRRKTGASGPCD